MSSITTRDTNAVVAALLRDLALIQRSKQSEWGYKRAAAVVRDLEFPLESAVQPGGTLEKISGIGPKSELVIQEVLRCGLSPTVERLVTESEKAAAVADARARRRNFLSRARVLAVLQDSDLAGVGRDDYRGDLQMHSVWSDGSQTLEDIVAAGTARRYEYCGVTDHSHGLRIARGVSMEDFREQHADMDALNAAGGFRLLKGVEANIRADGSVDVDVADMARFELVLAAPHSGLRTTENQTERMLRAVRTPGVHVLAHPRGRMYGSRAGVQADWDSVFAAAVEANVAIEIDGDPARQDVDFDLARAALDAGCVFALDSDAHAADELRYAETAIAHARLAGIPAERVINCWSLERLMAWLRERA